VYPGLLVNGFDDPDFVVAAVDAWRPTAVEDTADGLRVFFGSAADRDEALAALRDEASSWTCTPVDVPDEQWAERSQAALTHVRVGAITVAPPWDRPDDGSLVIVIQPSMGFGTGHHASTRLCLALLQEAAPAGVTVCDVGTGSGVLAIAALRLGAASVVAVDYDADALTSARESVELNQIAAGLDIRQVDLEQDATVAGAPFDLVLANLTGGMLMRLRDRILALTRPGGTVILSGITAEEAADVRHAFVSAGCAITGDLSEDGWVGLRLSRS
jgi:ribosomal protein L11 methyltransferase